MIVKRKIIDLGSSRYLGLPQDFDVKPGERIIIAHDKSIAFASRKVVVMTDEAFNTELQALGEMLKAARKVLQAEGISHETTRK